MIHVLASSEQGNGIKKRIGSIRRVSRVNGRALIGRRRLFPCPTDLSALAGRLAAIDDVVLSLRCPLIAGVGVAPPGLTKAKESYKLAGDGDRPDSAP